MAAAGKHALMAQSGTFLQLSIVCALGDPQDAIIVCSHGSLLRWVAPQLLGWCQQEALRVLRRSQEPNVQAGADYGILLGPVKMPVDVTARVYYSGRCLKALAECVVRAITTK